MAALIASVACIACGARTGIPGDDLPLDPIDAGDARADAPKPPPPGKCPATSGSGAPCGPLRFDLGTRETCALTTLTPPDALGSVPFTCPLNEPGCTKTLPGDCFGVLALMRFGKGHVAAFCDSTMLSELITGAKLLAYLGRTSSPRVARLGKGYFGSNPIGTDLGSDLPPKYLDPAVLAADWDVVIVSGVPYATATVSAAWAKALDAFVSDFGKGLLATLDYVKPNVPPSTLDPMNAITRPMGIEFQPVDLGYATLDVDLACVPDMP